MPDGARILPAHIDPLRFFAWTSVWAGWSAWAIFALAIGINVSLQPDRCCVSSIYREASLA